ncbi:OAS3-like protein [Mya arenaria]|uniref:OAS3-like protein n=1 Tax=Mya arenaria TaxID=6604 RepID=A0ABY7FZ34_MYAAR|nr:OAS3-like protein [Mya arenaria]
MDRWVKAGRPDSFDMTRAAHDVLTSLKNNRNFKILTPGLAKYDISEADKSARLVAETASSDRKREEDMFISGMDQFQTFVQPAKNLFSTRALNSHNKHKHSNTKILAQRFESVTIYERNQVPSTFAPTSVDLTTNGPSTDLYSVTDLDDFISSEIQPDSSFLAGTITLDEVYRKMTGSDASVKDFYSASLAPLQTELVRNLPTKVKSLIRLIKYWNKEKVKPMLLSRCPTSYLYEVIIMDRWVKTGRPDSFDMTRAAHDVLTSLKNNRDFKILTTELAKYDRRVADIRAETYIMDPCNPTNDLYNSRFWNWDGVSYVA